MNDEFLYRLRQPPPATFAARLRARLESQAWARRLRRRQITLYSLIACLLGGTAVALVVPSVREATSAMIREVLPGSLPEASESGPQPRPMAVRPVDRATREPASTPPPVASSPPAVTNAVVGIFAPGPTVRAQRAPASTSNVTYVAGGRTAPSPSVESRPLTQITVIGHAQAAAALYGASSEFQDLNRDIRIGLVRTSNNKAFSRFCAGEGDIAVATRMITPSELEACRRHSSEVTALPIAHEALVVLANVRNDWASGLRREDLRLLFNSSTFPNTMTWSQIDARWPAGVVEPAAPRPGTSFAGTFSELIFRVTPAERPGSDAPIGNEPLRLLQRVQRTLNGLTYLPYPVYLELQQRAAVRVIPIVNDSDLAVVPGRTSIADGSYELARPLLLFVRRRADRQAGVEGFVALVLSTAERRLAHLDFLPLSPAETELAAIVLRGLGETAPLDSSTQDVLSARGILLQQLPPHRREQARLKLESN